MKLEEKVNQLGIRKVLVVDDRMENIITAMNYFKTLESTGLKSDFAGSEKQAIEMIEKSAKNNSYYDVVLTDMQMEDKKSGLNVARYGFKNLAFSFIVTGGYHHDQEITNVEPELGELFGTKAEEKVWEGALDKSLEYLTGKAAETYTALRMYRKFVKKPSDKLAESMMQIYFELK